MSLFTTLSHGSSIEIPLPPTRSLPSMNCPPPSNKCGLEDSSITTTVRPSFLLFRQKNLQINFHASTVFLKHNTSNFMIYFVSKQINLYNFTSSHYRGNMHLVGFAFNLFLFRTIAYVRLPNTSMFVMQGIIL